MGRFFASRGLLSVAAALCSIGFAGSTLAAAYTYNFVNVGYLFGSGYNSSYSGGEYTQKVSSNLPVSLDFGNTSYNFGIAADPGSVASGTWNWSNGTDSLYGTLRTTTQEVSYAGTPFTRYTGSSVVTGGTGYFSGASGSGTNEVYAYYLDTGDPDYFYYQGVGINRMSVTGQTDAPIIQTDTRGVSVSVRNGVENLEAGTATNSAIFTSGSPSLQPVPETEVSNYTFQPLPIAGPPFVGTWFDTGPLGTIQGTSFGDTVVYGHLGTIFNYAPGEATTTGGTGIYAGTVGSRTTYESFAVGTGGLYPTATTYSAIGINRVTPVPEPEIYAMMVAGLGLMGFATRRRKMKEIAAT